MERSLAEEVDAALAGLGCDLVELRAALQRAKPAMLDLLRVPPPSAASRAEVATMHPQTPIGRVRLDAGDVQQVYLLSDALRLDEITALLALVTAHDERGSATAEAAAGVFFDERAAVARTLHALLSSAAVPSDATPPAVAELASSFVRDLLSATVEGEGAGDEKRCALIKRLVEVIDDAGLEPEEGDDVVVPSSSTLPASLGGAAASVAAPSSTSWQRRSSSCSLSVVVDARGCEVDRRSLIAAERATLCECLLFAVRLRRPALGAPDAAAVVDLARAMALRARFAASQQQQQLQQRKMQQQQLQRQQQRGGGGGIGDFDPSSSSSLDLPCPVAVTPQHAHLATLAAVAALLPAAAAAPVSTATEGGGAGEETTAASVAAAAASAAAAAATAEDEAALAALASDPSLAAKLDAPPPATTAAEGGENPSTTTTPPPPISMLSPHSQYHQSSSSLALAVPASADADEPTTPPPDDEALAAILRVAWGALVSLHGPATAAARDSADAAVSAGLDAGALRSLARVLRSPELAADATPSARRACAAAAHDALLGALLESDAGRDAVSDLAARSSERASLASEREEAAANAAAAAREAEQQAAAAAGLYLPPSLNGASTTTNTPFAAASSSSTLFREEDFADPFPNADGLEHVLDLLAACLSTAPELWLDPRLRSGVVAEFLEYCASHPVLTEAPAALAAYARVLCSVARGGAGGAAAVLNQLRSSGTDASPPAAISWRQGFGAMIAYCERYSGPSSASASAAAAAAADEAAAAAASLYGGVGVDAFGNPLPPQQQQQLQHQASTTSAPPASELAVPDSDAEGMASYARLAAAVLRSAPRSEAAAWRAALEAEAGGVPLAELALQLMCHPVPQRLKAALDALLESLAREPGAAMPLLDRLALVLLAPPSPSGVGGGGGFVGGAPLPSAAAATSTLGYFSSLGGRATPAAAAAGAPSSSLPRYDVSYQLSEVEARSEDYCETLALVKLLTTSLKRAAAATAVTEASSPTSSFLPDAGVHYSHLASFVRRDVLGAVLSRGFRDQAQRWRLASAALDHACEWLSLAKRCSSGTAAAFLDARRLAAAASAAAASQRRQAGGAENVDAGDAMALLHGGGAGNRFAPAPVSSPPTPLPPALETMLDLLSEGDAFRVSLAVLAPGADALAAEARARVAVGAARERAVRSALRLLRLGMQLDGAALSAARAAGIGGVGKGGGARPSPSSVYQPLDAALRRELWRVPALLDYCRYAPDPGVQAEALRLARQLSPRLAAAGPAAVDALLQAGAVGLLQQQQQLVQREYLMQQQMQVQQQMQQGGGGGLPFAPPFSLPQRQQPLATPPADRVRDGFAACLTDGLFGAGARPRNVSDLWWWEEDEDDDGDGEEEDGGGKTGGWGSDDDGDDAENDVDVDGSFVSISSSSSSNRDPRARLVLDVLLDSSGADAARSPSLAHLLLGYDVRRGTPGLASSSLDARFGGACAAPLLRAALTPALADVDPVAAANVLEVWARLASCPAPWRSGGGGSAGVAGSGAGGPARALLRRARVVPLRLAALASDVRGSERGNDVVVLRHRARTAALLLRLAGEELLRSGGPDDQKTAAAAAAAGGDAPSSSSLKAAAATKGLSPSRRRGAAGAGEDEIDGVDNDDADEAAAGVEDLAAALLDRGGEGDASSGGGGWQGVDANEGGLFSSAASTNGGRGGELAASLLLSLVSSAAADPPLLWHEVDDDSFSSSSAAAVRAAGAALGVEEALAACCSTTTTTSDKSSKGSSAAGIAVFDVAALASELGARLAQVDATSSSSSSSLAASKAACRAALRYAAAHNAWAAASASAGEVATAWAGAVGLLFGRRFGAVCRVAAAAEAKAAAVASASASAAVGVDAASSASSSPSSDPDAGAALAVELARRALQACSACLVGATSTSGSGSNAASATTLARAARSLLSRAREVCSRSAGAPGEPPLRARSPAALRGSLDDALEALTRARGGVAAGQRSSSSSSKSDASAREALHGCLLEILRLAAPRLASSSSISPAVSEALVASAPGGAAAGAAARDAEERAQALIDRSTATALASSPGLVEGIAADALSNSGSSPSAPARLTALALLAEMLAPAARDSSSASSPSFFGNDDDASAAAAALQSVAAAVSASGLPARLASSLAAVHPLALVSGGGNSTSDGVVAALELEASLALLLRLARAGGGVGSSSTSDGGTHYGSGVDEAAAAASAEIHALSRCAALDLEPEDPVGGGIGGGSGRSGFGIGRNGSGGGNATASSFSSSFAAPPRPGSARAALSRVLPPALRLVLVRLHCSSSAKGSRASGSGSAPSFAASFSATATAVSAPAEVVAAAAAFVAAHRGSLVRVLLEAGAPGAPGGGIGMGWEPTPDDLDTASLVLSLLTALRGAASANDAAASASSSATTLSPPELEALSSLHGAAPELRAAALRLAARFFRVDARSDAPGPLRLAAAREAMVAAGDVSRQQQRPATAAAMASRRRAGATSTNNSGLALATFDDATPALPRRPSADERRALEALASSVLRLRLAAARFVLGECAGHGLVLAAALPPAATLVGGATTSTGRLSLVSIKDALFQCVENLMGATEARGRALAAVREASSSASGSGSGAGGGENERGGALPPPQMQHQPQPLSSSAEAAAGGVSPELLAAASAADAATRKLLTLAEVCLAIVYVNVVGAGAAGGGVRDASSTSSAVGSRADVAQLGRLLSPVLDALARGPLVSSSSAAAIPGGASRAEALAALARRVEVALAPPPR